MKKLIFAFVVLVTGAALSAEFEHPNLKSGKKRVGSIILMPVQVELTKCGMKGAEPMIEESREAEKNLAPLFASALRKLGPSVEENAFPPEVLAKDAQLRYALDDLQKRFDAELKQMARKSKDVRKGRFTLGDSVAKLPAGSSADALLFVRVSGKVYTGSKKAFSWAVSWPVGDDVDIFMGLVDANSGDVLYYARAEVGNVAKKPGGARSDIEHAFKPFAKFNRNPKLKAASGAGATQADGTGKTADTANPEQSAKNEAAVNPEQSTKNQVAVNPEQSAKSEERVKNTGETEEATRTKE